MTSTTSVLFQIQFRKQENMTEHSLWRFSRALHRAINERRREDLEALLDDDVDWAIYGRSTCSRFSARAAARPR